MHNLLKYQIFFRMLFKNAKCCSPKVVCITKKLYRPRGWLWNLLIFRSCIILWCFALVTNFQRLSFDSILIFQLSESQGRPKWSSPKCKVAELHLDVWKYSKKIKNYQYLTIESKLRTEGCFYKESRAPCARARVYYLQILNV